MELLSESRIDISDTEGRASQYLLLFRNNSNADDYERIQSLNLAYREKFEFPFVMAVKGFERSDILAAFEARLTGDEDSERVRSLSEIYKIARFRLDDLVS